MPGTIFTFYSYKGGTGRTMVLANVAWIMASNGYRVLVVDWDLDSPGLHRYLRPFLRDRELTDTPGVIDFLWRAARGENALLEDNVLQLNCRFRSGGSIAFLPAGRQDRDYAQRVNTFDWSSFYERVGGAGVLSAVRNALRAAYDYVLIDSRTGISDTSGICTVQLPDLLVLPFTLNHQNIKGAAGIAASVRAMRGEAFPIFPVPTRIELGEQDRLVAATTYARMMFAPFLLHVQSNRRAVNLEQQARYWQDVETPYVPFYAFEEVPAVLRDESGSRRGLLAPSERLASWITDRAMSLKSEGEEWRKGLVTRYAFDLLEASGLRAEPPGGESPPEQILRITIRWLSRHRWRLATTVLVGVILASVLEGWLARPSDLSSQLAGVMEDLRKIESFSSDHSDLPNFPKAELADAQVKLQVIRDTLNKKGKMAKPPPSTPQRQ